MKSLLELYDLLLTRFKTNNLNIGCSSEHMSFICNNIKHLHADEIITLEEKLLLIRHFRKEKPSRKKHVEFYNHPYFNGKEVWFSTNKDPKLAYAIRVQLLSNIIANLKEEDASN